MKENMKIILSICCIAIQLISLVSCQTAKAGNSSLQEMTVTILDVGSADCIVIQTSNHTIMIDTGTDDESDTILSFLEENMITTIDYLIITHFDKDHVGGADKIIDAIGIGQIMQPDYVRDSKQYEEYAEAIKEKQIPVTELTEDMEFVLDDVEIAIYAPVADFAPGDDNNYSLVTSVIHGENKFLFAGDAEEIRLRELLDKGIGEYTFLKVPHHGVLEDNSEDFFCAVNPRYVAITCSMKEPAEDEVIELLERISTVVFLVSDGTVTCISNGTQITVSN